MRRPCSKRGGTEPRKPLVRRASRPRPRGTVLRSSMNPRGAGRRRRKRRCGACSCTSSGSVRPIRRRSARWSCSRGFAAPRERSRRRSRSTRGSRAGSRSIPKPARRAARSCCGNLRSPRCARAKWTKPRRCFAGRARRTRWRSAPPIRRRSAASRTSGHSTTRRGSPRSRSRSRASSRRARKRRWGPRCRRRSPCSIGSRSSASRSVTMARR